MKLALVGADPELVRIAHWIHSESDHRVIAIHNAGRFEEELFSLFPKVRPGEDWHALLANDAVDAALISRRPDDDNQLLQRADQLKKMIDAKVPLLVMHPACLSIDAIECEMIRRDTQCIIVPFLPFCDHPAFQTLKKIVGSEESDIGPIEQVVVERFAQDRERAPVLNAFSCDAVLFAELIGPIRQVGAMSTDQGNLGFANLSVNLTGKSLKSGRWSISPVDDFSGSRLTVIGLHGKAELEMPIDSLAYRLTLAGTLQETPNWGFSQACESTLNQLEDQVRERFYSTKGWDLVRHGLEVGDNAEQSCRRRRTIEILGEEPTEEDTFKAIMTAGGCFMLFWVLLLLPFDGLIPDHPIIRGIWYSFFLLPLGVFLGLQLLKLLFREQKENVKSPT